MKVGRNDPCPCGSGKKFKKCCLLKNLDSGKGPVEVAPSQAPALPRPLSEPSRRPRAAERLAFTPEVKRPAPPAQPPDPAIERLNARWEEFTSKDSEGKIAVFLQTLDEKELMDNEMAVEMLSSLRTDALQRGERARFAEWVSALRERQPAVYEESADMYLSWALQDAIVENRLDDAGALARQLGAMAGRDIDQVNRSMEMVAYHGQLSMLVEMRRIGWPEVKSASDIVPWGISRFAEKGVDLELFDQLEHNPALDAADNALLERIKFFIDDPNPDYLRRSIDHLTGKAARAWKVDDFTLQPPRKREDDWDEEEEEEERPPDEGAHNLSLLITEFVGYLRREEGVSFARGHLVEGELYRYFIRRHAGDLDPQPSMLERARYPNLKLPKPPKPDHPLCPERVTFEVCLAGFMGVLSLIYHVPAALFEIIPAWLRFLESRGLIDADRRIKTVEELRPLHASMLKLWETFTEDPALYRAAQEWPADAARGPGEVRP